MGGAASPVIAEIVMNKLLYYVIDRVSFEFPFIYQYVDDLLTAVPLNLIESTLEIFNSFHSDLTFTVETETDRSVPFLDTKVIRTSENLVILDWHRKVTSSGRYIPFTSYHPKKQKINMIVALTDRIKKLKKRLTLHKSDCKLKPNITSLSAHVNDTGHSVMYDEAVVLKSEKNLFKRKFLEMCYINCCSNSLNRKKDVEGLSSIYTYLLNQSRTAKHKLPEFFDTVRL
ncbi:uncharacterized protein LOC132705527 [Cylas formicarius]|uniref:uncharacterized protein LOC132705527 n=1 Tax=Cylas formicarius TaxID=197179 RepID=UPI002958CF17|nr:uncharacterized protein LOC132705527 [Cylas formicarius]